MSRIGDDPLDEREPAERFKDEHRVWWFVIYTTIVLGMLALGFLAALTLSVVLIKVTITLLGWIWAL